MKNKYNIPLLACLAPFAALASDGTADVNNEYPAVGAYYELMVSNDGTVEWAEESCTATLISPSVAITAAHCTSYNTEHDGLTGYYNEAWMSFDTYASKNDFHCFLRNNNLDHGVSGPEDNSAADQLPCYQNENEAGIPAHPIPAFYKVKTTGWVNGKSVTVGITHPDYLKDKVRPDGTIHRRVAFLGNLTDLAVLLLEIPMPGHAMLPLAPLGYLDTLANLHDIGMIDVGYGLDWVKVTGQQPTSGLGPQQLAGGSGVRRIADLGTVQTLHANSITPTQQPTQGDNTVCFGDSGSPMFLDANRDGHADAPVTIAGILSGYTNWCQGSLDPYTRVDTASAQNFIGCVLNAGNNYAQVRNCGGEKNIAILTPCASSGAPASSC